MYEPPKISERPQARRSTVLLLLLVSVAWLVAASFASAQSEALPNPRLTPGATLPVSASEVCTVGYTKTVRDVPASLKRAVYASYGPQT